ncbi:MAG: lytic transglycosylase domain-containing protein [Proteobacteria bacterium]|nr:lytic transglycosylase domain-containing protein [Pseudomonadota bacterium]
MAQAEFFIYQGPNGERMVSDRPVRGYSLVTRRDTVKDAGHILANRPIRPGGPARFKSYIRSASDRYGVDAALVEAVIAVESGFDPDAVSNRGATGLMQLMSATAQQYAVRDRFDPRQNINGGVQHLKHLLDRFDGDITLVLAAYNAGAGAVERYRGVPPFAETRRYIRKVLEHHSRYRALRYGS